MAAVAVLTNTALSHAHAQMWRRVDSVFNPSGVSVQNFSAPEFADLNGDGWYDLLLGSSSSSGVDCFINLGGTTPPRFVRDTTVLASIYAGGIAGTNSDYPAACDLDDDGDLDLVIGGFNGLLFYANIGDTLAPQWLRVDTTFSEVNPLIGTDAKPAFADLDGDGDLDMLVGIGESLFGGPTAGITMGFRNSGSPSFPHFVRDSTLVAGIPDIGLNSYPTLSDVDGDGDVDLLLGRDLATLVYLRNTGTRTQAVWTANAATFSGVESATYWKDPTLSDIDQDGDVDLTYGTADGTLFVYENIGSATVPQFQRNSAFFAVIRISGNGASVSLGDFDNDEDVDMISGDWLGGIQYFRNDGSPLGPRFTKTTATFSSIDAGSYSTPVFVDIEGDGDLDIVSGALDGSVYCYINTGQGFTQNSTIFAAIDLGYRSSPAFADIDGDGDPDMLVGSEEGSSIQFYRHDPGHAFVPDGAFLTGISSVRDGHPTFGDLDGDGDFDLIIGGGDGALLYYENTGSRWTPVWHRSDALLSEVQVQQDAAPALADLDGDAKPDLIVGEYNGNFSYFINAIPTSARPDSRPPERFRVEQNYPNPFNPATTILYGLPQRSHATLTVFNMLGQQVATLVDGEQEAGYHEVRFDGSGLASGVYFYRLQAGGFVASRTLTLVK